MYICLLQYSDLNGKTQSSTHVENLGGKIYKRKSWGCDSLFFSLHIPTNDEAPYFAYCDKYGVFKEKTGFSGNHIGREYSTVGEGVLKKTDIIEIKKVEKMAKADLTATINLVGTTITVGECTPMDDIKSEFETKKKWAGDFYNEFGVHVEHGEYRRKKDATKVLKRFPTRTLVLYKMVEVITVDMPLKVEEV